MLPTLNDEIGWDAFLEGYLRAGDFVNQGTDRSGRKYALEGFKSLQGMLVWVAIVVGLLNLVLILGRW